MDFENSSTLRHETAIPLLRFANTSSYYEVNHIFTEMVFDWSESSLEWFRFYQNHAYVDTQETIQEEVEPFKVSHRKYGK